MLFFKLLTDPQHAKTRENIAPIGKSKDSAQGHMCNSWKRIARKLVALDASKQRHHIWMVFDYYLTSI